MTQNSHAAVAQSADGARQYDVVIIGGGIAGIAIAELLSRLTDLRILVLERAPQLGTGSSGRLEGWYHTGALYAGLQDPQMFLNCVRAVEDLYNLYRQHPHCNLELTRMQEVFVPSIRRDDDQATARWLNPCPIHYILPLQDAPDFDRASRGPGDRFPFWQQQRSLMTLRLVNSFLHHDWKAPGGFCRGPDRHTIEQDRPRIGREASRADLGAFATHPVVRDTLDRFCHQYDGNGQQSRYEYFRFLDCSMNPDRILKDLVASSLESGRVDYQPGITLETVLVGDHRRVEGVLYREAQGRRLHVKAELFILAAGASIGELMRADMFPLEQRPQTVQSAMVVVKPALTPVNFVRMSLDPARHFNHVHRAFRHEGVSGTYSLLADSGYTNGGGEPSAHAASHILEEAERYFGRDPLRRHAIYEYACLKTECVPAHEEGRHYSYWVGHKEDENYLCVLPGKFSMFPSVALQTYRQIREKTCFAGRAAAWPSCESLKSSLKDGTISVSEASSRTAEEYVAPPYPQTIITA